MSSLSSIACSANVAASLVPTVSTISGNLMVQDRTDETITAGSGAGQADGCYTTVVSVVSGTPLVINLLALTDPFGAAITVAHLVAIKITNVSGTGVLTHGGGTNPVYASQSLTIGVGDFFAHSFNAAGVAVVVSSTQNLQVTTSTGTSSVRVTVLTRSA